MKITELRELAKQKGLTGYTSMNKETLLQYINTGVKYKNNQEHRETQTDNEECNDCQLKTALTILKKEAEKIEEKKRKKELKENTIVTITGEVINTANGELLGFSSCLDRY